MVKTALVEKDIEGGKRLLEELDKSDFPVSAAFWFYMTESDEWRLIIGTEIKEKFGTQEAYARLETTLSRIKPSVDLSLLNVTVVNPDDSLIKLLRIAIVTTGSGIAGIRFTRNTINNVFIEDAYIYRNQKHPGTAALASS